MYDYMYWYYYKRLNKNTSNYSWSVPCVALTNTIFIHLALIIRIFEYFSGQIIISEGYEGAFKVKLSFLPYAILLNIIVYFAYRKRHLKVLEKYKNRPLPKFWDWMFFFLVNFPPLFVAIFLHR